MSESSVLIVFPNQLFKNHPGLKAEIKKIVIVEDSLFFGDISFQSNFFISRSYGCIEQA